LPAYTPEAKLAWLLDRFGDAGELSEARA